MPARRRKLRGGGTPLPNPNSISDPLQVAQAVTNTAQGAQNWGADALKNPYTTTAVMACAFLFLIPMSIYSFTGKSDSVLVNEILLSFMAMAISASGISYYVLQGRSEEIFHNILLGICAISSVAWIYFAYKISSKDDDKKDD
jgi:hypothetical protein